MAWTMYNAGEVPNLVTVSKRLDPNGKISKIAEVLAKFDPILDDIPLVEGNLPTGHRHVIRADIPTPTWRKLNYGVRPNVSHTLSVEDTIGMLEAYSEVDKDLAMLNGNTAEFRLSEDVPQMESMTQMMASTIFYGDTISNPERFLGLAPRYSALGDPTVFGAQSNSGYLKHVINAGGSTASKQTSIWYIVWGEDSVFGLYPKGSKVGLQHNDLGEVTLFDNDGGRYQGFRSHYQWKMGLAVKDWRYIVRIGNVELANMVDATAMKNLYQAIIKAIYTVPQNGRRGTLYCSPGVQAMLDIAAIEKANAALGYANVFGKEVLSFRGIPIKACNSILETEAVLS